MAKLDLAPLSSDSVHSAAAQLIDTFADYVAKARELRNIYRPSDAANHLQGGTKLLESVTTAKDLSAMKAAVFAAAQNPAKSLPASQVAAGGAVTPEWGAVCRSVLNREADVWALFEGVFLQRAKELARLAFGGLSIQDALFAATAQLRDRNSEGRLAKESNMSFH